MSQSVKLSEPLHNELSQIKAEHGLSSMAAAVDHALHDRDPTCSQFVFASASTQEVGSHIPTTVIPNVDEPTLSMWETMEKRLIEAPHYMREEAAKDDVFMILSSIRSACIIGLWKLAATNANDSGDTIKEIHEWIDATGLIKAFTGGGIGSDDKGALHNWHVHGKYAIFIWRDGKAGGGKITKFVNVPVDGLRKFTNPQDPTQYYYYQKFNKESDWLNPDSWDDVHSNKDKGEDVPSEEQRVWYIEGGEKSRDATDVDGNRLYPSIQPDDWVNTRENLIFVTNPMPPLNDEIVTTIMIKRYLMRMSIVPVQVGIVPFYRIVFGNADVLPTPTPNERLKDTNIGEYNKQLADFNLFKTNMETMVNNVDVAIRNGKPIAYQYGVTVERDEPRMALTAEFMQTVIGIENDIIARAIKLPMSLIESSGTELATSQIVRSVIDILQQADQLGFYDVIMYFIKLEFAKKVDDEGIKIVLQNLDKANIKTLSEIRHLDAQAMYAMWQAGATPDTLAEFANESDGIPVQDADMTAMRDGSNNKSEDTQ